MSYLENLLLFSIVESTLLVLFLSIIYYYGGRKADENENNKLHKRIEELQHELSRTYSEVKVLRLAKTISDSTSRRFAMNQISRHEAEILLSQLLSNGCRAKELISKLERIRNGV